MTQGTIKWFSGSKGFGFIAPEGGGADLFVHQSEVAGYNFHGIPDNQAVEFEITQGPKGPQAVSVRVL
ncbi:putative cold-shock DNA-binding protein [Lentzea atacamensis]|uniref:Cold-shock DNA-binding protein n=1 Tax=Lentzea atacamensis TaxID=531938 RepID=A0A316HUN3_9PSEU|nr:cold shock domain-containing protein [Lentzea atacamensis]PWK83788.1 putative cold-shock DNA-binding protein [Lentzea atacamensis]RAS70456.1 putative cold-shock DNA-binding protein [Lentzea atacamensis]